jgi:hypothetical protein
MGLGIDAVLPGPSCHTLGVIRALAISDRDARPTASRT